jgi:hypothetical protein
MGEGRNKWSLAICISATELSGPTTRTTNSAMNVIYLHFDRKQIPIFLKNEFMVLPCCVCGCPYSQVWYLRYAIVRLYMLHQPMAFPEKR